MGSAGGTGSVAQVAITTADLADLNEIMEIEAASFTAPWTRRMFEVELGSNPFARVLAARSDKGALLGYVCFWVVFEEFRLMTLAVHPACRRRGIGALLLQEALARGRGEGASRAILEVRASNGAALELYERAGFRRHAVRPSYYDHPVEDAVLMELAFTQEVEHGSH